MRAYVAVTDFDWFDLLSRLHQLDEVNFWQPSGNRLFKALDPGELFLFKLHSPNDYIVGGGVFAHSTILPISLAWESFTTSNGSRSLLEMRSRVGKYRTPNTTIYDDYKIGCILLEQPFFLPQARWLPIPSDWKINIVQGKTYNLLVEPGLSIWKNLQFAMIQTSLVREIKPQYGEPTAIIPRLGQGSFRVMVTDAYDRRCSITNERTLPALDAAHIKPFSESGKHAVDNGILIRRDIHALFDKGYVTITPSMKLEVSRKIREEFENGRDYYKFHGNSIRPPVSPKYYPAKEYLEWHNIHVYRG
ncbi:MAG: HNH endonuclease [Dehalococcoidia bacterium]|nr:HNH endonuclease [Dehalococcoidia bacterium]MDD5494335.1 HNH endonuclease [Dehalococcoidia bacterium]